MVGMTGPGVPVTQMSGAMQHPNTPFTGDCEFDGRTRKMERRYHLLIIRLVSQNADDATNDKQRANTTWSYSTTAGK